jgi:plastocyanin
MRASTIATTLAALLVTGTSAGAATFIADLKDASGRAAPDTVVSLEPETNTPIASHLPDQAIIDQRRETFLPMVIVVRKGGHVVFTNNDVTKHQVYSFSPIRQFQVVIGQGESSKPISFPQSGIAAIGCNIHDQMIAYVFVGQTPYAGVTDENGRAIVSDVVPGRYRLAVWHPQMGVIFAPARVELDVKDDSPHYSAVLPITIVPAHGMKHMHTDY